MRNRRLKFISLAWMLGLIPFGVAAQIMRWIDWTNIAIFVVVVAGLIGLMAVFHLPPMFAALYVFLAIAGTLVTAHVVALARARSRSPREFIAPINRFVDTFANMTADLTLLLATLSIMTGAFVITGVPTKIGALLVAAAGVNLAAMAIMAFVFGALLGTGLRDRDVHRVFAVVVRVPARVGGGGGQSA